MYKLEDIFKFAKVKIWNGGSSYNTKDNVCEIQDCYMQSNEENIKPFYDELEVEYKKILIQILSQVLHHDDFARFILMTIVSNARNSILKEANGWIEERENEIEAKVKVYREEKEQVIKDYHREKELKEDLERQLHDIQYRMKKIKEVAY